MISMNNPEYIDGPEDKNKNLYSLLSFSILIGLLGLCLINYHVQNKLFYSSSSLPIYESAHTILNITITLGFIIGSSLTIKSTSNKANNNFYSICSVLGYSLLFLFFIYLLSVVYSASIQNL